MRKIKNALVLMLSMMFCILCLASCEGQVPKGFEDCEKFTLDGLTIWLPKDYHAEEQDSDIISGMTPSMINAYHKKYPVPSETISFGKSQKQDMDDYSKTYFTDEYSKSFDSFELISYEKTKISEKDTIIVSYSCEYSNVHMWQKQYMVFCEDETYIIITTAMSKDKANIFDNSIKTLTII